MTPFRALLLLIAFVGLALAVVALRAEQTRAAARTLSLRLKQVEARRELWQVQATVARLRSPEMIQGKLKQLNERTTFAGSLPEGGVTPVQ